MTTQETNAARLSQVHPVLAKRVKQALAGASILGIEILITQGLRDYPTQQKLYDKGRSVKSDICCTHNGRQLAIGSCEVHPLGATVTNAKPGWSWHQFGLAVDAAPLNKNLVDWNPSHPEWKKMLAAAKSFSLAEGAEWRTFPDYPHFYPVELQPTPGDDIRSLYAAGGITAVWQWADGVLRK